MDHYKNWVCSVHHSWHWWCYCQVLQQYSGCLVWSDRASVWWWNICLDWSWDLTMMVFLLRHQVFARMATEGATFQTRIVEVKHSKQGILWVTWAGGIQTSLRLLDNFHWRFGSAYIVGPENFKRPSLHMDPNLRHTVVGHSLCISIFGLWQYLFITVLYTACVPTVLMVVVFIWGRILSSRGLGRGNI